jgi:hypothetical protein
MAYDSLRNCPDGYQIVPLGEINLEVYGYASA